MLTNTDILAKRWIEVAKEQLKQQYSTNCDTDPIVDLYELCDSNPGGAVKIILKIISLKPELAVIHFLGAGPLEDILSKHFDEYYEFFINESDKNIILHEALCNVYLDKNDTAHYLEFYNKLGIDAPFT